MRKYSLVACLMSMLLLAAYSSVEAETCQSSFCCDEWSVGSGKFKVGADWLYWQVNQDNLDVASIIRYETDLNSPRSCRHINQNERWDSGYRVNLGYEFCDCWDLELYYTHLPTHKNSRRHHVEGNDYFILSPEFEFVDYLSLDPLNSLHAKWRSELSWLDLDISRKVCFGECLTFRPHIGFRALWSNRKFHVHGSFPDPIVRDSLILDNPRFAAHLKDDLTGYGVEGGFWGNWELGCGLSLVGHVGGSILYSKHKVHQHAANFVYDAGPTGPTGSTGAAVDAAREIYVDPIVCRDSHIHGIPTMDYFIGLQYDSTFCDFVLSGRIGWEQHIFFDINRISRNRGNLSAQGLTLGIEAAF